MFEQQEEKQYCRFIYFPSLHVQFEVVISRTTLKKHICGHRRKKTIFFFLRKVDGLASEDTRDQKHLLCYAIYTPQDWQENNSN